MFVSGQGVSYPAVCAGCLFFILVLLRPLADVDLFTQIILGHQILSAQAVPVVERLIVGREGQPVPAIGWLAQIGFAVLESNLGLAAVRVLNALCFGVAIGIVLRGTTQLVPALGAGLLTFLAISTSATPRPQMFAVLFFALLVSVVRGELSNRMKFATVLLIGTLWQNIHPSVPVAIIYVFMDGLVRGRIEAIARLPLLFALLVATLLTPDGVHIYEVSAQNSFISRNVLGVSEWLPAYDPSVLHAMEGFWLTVLISLPLLYLNWKQRTIDGRALAAPILFLVATLFSARFVLFFGLTMVPVWYQLLSGAFRSVSKFDRYARLFASSLILLSGVALATVSQQVPISGSIPFDEIGSIVRPLRERAVPAVYNYREWAGPIAYLSEGTIRTVIDGRLYLYDVERWSAYQSEARGESSVEELVKRYGTTVFILRPSFHGGLVKRLREHPLCEKTYEAELVTAWECRIVP